MGRGETRVEGGERALHDRAGISRFERHEACTGSRGAFHDNSCGGLQLPCEQPEQGGLATAVRADDAQARIVGKGEGDALEERHALVGKRKTNTGA